MRRFFASFILLCLAMQMATGQVSDLTWHSLDLQDGLSEANNAFVYKDSRGFVWISSVSGLNRFDGTSVKVYMPDKSDPSTLLDENIQSPFYEDAQQDLWFTTYEAIHKYNFNTDCFDQYQVRDRTGKDSTDTPLRGYYIFYLDPDQYLWLLVEFRLLYTFHIPTGTLEYKGEVNINSIRCYNVTDEAGNLKQILMKGRNWAGIQAVDVSSSRKVSSPYLLSDSDLMNVQSIKQIIPEGDSALWMLHAKSLVHYSKHSRQVISFPLNEDPEGMIRYRDSLLVIGTQTVGLKVFHIRKKRFLQMHGLTGPVSPTGKLQKIKYISQDREGVIWVSTEGVGLHYAYPEKKKFHTIRFADYLDRNTEIKPIRLFEETPGNLLCFTEADGVLQIRFDENEFGVEYYPPLESLGSMITNSVEKEAKERYWISTYSGLFVYSKADHALTRVTDSADVMLSTYAGLNGHIYCTSTAKGFYEAFFENGKPVCRSVRTEFKDKVINPVMVDSKNRIWLHFHLETFGIYDPETFDSLGGFPLNGLCTSMSSTADDPTIFIGAYNGLYEIDEPTLTIRKVHSEKTGFPTASIFSLLRKANGRLWIGHSNGIASYDPVSGAAKAYTTEDGLPPTAYTEAACALHDGRFCFGTIGGITVFHPDSVRDIYMQAIPQITSIQLNDKPPPGEWRCEKNGATHFPAMEKIVLPYRNNTISFAVHSLEYSAPESNKIEYKMEGLDPDFVEGQNGTRVRYPAMPPGTYHFVMFAFNSDGIRNPVPRTLEIVIQRPYYMTWWFMTLVALTLFSILAYIIYLRFTKKLELQNIRLKLYENLHDDVGSRLTAIVLSAEELEQNEQISHPKIKAISKIARSIVGNMRRLVWAIDPENDRMTSIVQKINHDKSLILDDHIAFSIDVDERLKNIVLPGEIRYQISSVCNEAFTNIAKYAQASQVSVQITRENKSIKLMVTDNGKGFDPEEKRKNTLQGSGYGMSNMQRRASRAGGVFKVHSRPGQGTQIEFQFPFHIKGPKKI